MEKQSFKLDKKDRKIIYELDKDARQPYSILAKKVGLSEEVVNYRVKRLVEEGIIKKFITVINTTKLGYLSFRVYLHYQNVDPEKEKEIHNYFMNHPNIFWFASLSGSYDLEILIFAKSFYNYNQIMDKIMNEYGQYLKESVLSTATFSFHFKRKYLVDIKEELPKTFYGGEPELIALDEIDKKILAILSDNARIKITDMAAQLNMVSNSVKYRIKRLKEKGIIQTYRLWIDTHKLGYELYKALITLDHVDDKIRNQILTFCNDIPNILYFIRCTGLWNVEIESEVESNKDFREIMFEFRKKFNQYIRDFETLLVYEDHKINYFPEALQN